MLPCLLSTAKTMPPDFARLDFIPAGEKPETWYLGRWGVLDPVTLSPEQRRAAGRVLYVMLTRPLHRLTVVHKGAPSPMLADR